MTTAITLSEYFQAVERRIETRFPVFTDLVVRICGRKILLHFQTEAQADRARLSFAGIYEDKTDGIVPDAQFYYWIDDLDSYLPSEGIGKTAVWNSKDMTGTLQIISTYGMIGIDRSRNSYYLCVRDGTQEEQSNHTLITLLSRWALRNDMLVMHSAAAGVDGHGVLIGARGGRGKSTLSVSCLLRGMDFVSDDYILMNRNGPLKAMPLYRTVGLNPDMAKILRPDLPVLRIEESFRGKLLLDASSMPYCEELFIHGIIFPSITEDESPSFIEDEESKAIIQMVHSTMNQLYLFRDLPIVRMMLQRVSGLPVYEMRLTRDPQANAAALENFIREMNYQNAASECSQQ